MSRDHMELNNNNSYDTTDSSSMSRFLRSSEWSMPKSFTDRSSRSADQLQELPALSLIKKVEAMEGVKNINELDAETKKDLLKLFQEIIDLLRKIAQVMSASPIDAGGGNTASGEDSGFQYPVNSGYDSAADSQSFNTDDSNPASHATRQNFIGSQSTESLSSDQTATKPDRNGAKSSSTNSTDFFFTQFADPKWNPNGKPFSEDCGPTSLAMAMKYFGAIPAGADANDPESMINASRLAMTGNLDNVGTNTDQVMRGAQAVGLNANYVNSMDEIDQALARGQMVVTAGDPGPYIDDFQWTAQDYATDGNGGLYRSGHFVLVVGKDGDKYVVNDPACKDGPIELTAGQLTAYFNGPDGGGGVAVGHA